MKGEYVKVASTRCYFLVQ